MKNPSQSNRNWKQLSLGLFLVSCVVVSLILAITVQYLTAPKEHQLAVPDQVTFGETKQIADITEDEVMRAIERNVGLWSELAEDFDSFVLTQMKIEPIEERVDPARMVPLIGEARLHHRLFRCELQGTQNGEFQTRIILVDQNHFHVTDPQQTGLASSKPITQKQRTPHH